MISETLRNDLKSLTPEEFEQALERYPMIALHDHYPSVALHYLQLFIWTKPGTRIDETV